MEGYSPKWAKRQELQNRLYGVVLPCSSMPIKTVGLDLYVGNYVEWSPETDIFCPPGGTEKLYCIPAAYTGIPSRFFINNRDGTFSDVTEESGFYPTLGKSLGVVELDFNHDGWSDLAVANDGEGDLLYRNNPGWDIQ